MLHGRNTGSCERSRRAVGRSRSLGMSTCCILGGAAALTLAPAAAAELIGTAITLGPVQHPDLDVVTYRLHLVFDVDLDGLLAINGNAEALTEKPMM